MTDAETAWAAGLFEGEGCICLMPETTRWGGNRRRPWVALSISSTDRDVLERFHMIVGVGGVTFHHRGARPHHKPCWAWHLSARDKVEALLSSFMPWLGQRRRAKAQEALALLAEQRQIRKCEYCGGSFESYHGFQRFCCKKHQEKAWYEQSKASGDRTAYSRSHYLRNREAYLERSRKQHARDKASQIA